MSKEDNQPSSRELKTHFQLIPDSREIFKVVRENKIRTKGDGSCAWHSIFGEGKKEVFCEYLPVIWEQFKEEVRKILLNKDDSSFRSTQMRYLISYNIKNLLIEKKETIKYAKTISGLMTEGYSKLDAVIYLLVTEKDISKQEAIKDLLWGGDICKYKALQELAEKYQEFLTAQTGYEDESWKTLCAELEYSPEIKEFISRQDPTNLRRAFYNTRKEKEDQLLQMIPNGSKLQDALKMYIESTYDLDWEHCIKQQAISEYIDFLTTPGRFLLENELMMIALVFNKGIIFYPSTAPDFLLLNINEETYKDAVGVQLDAKNSHYERVPVSVTLTTGPSISKTKADLVEKKCAKLNDDQRQRALKQEEEILEKILRLIMLIDLNTDMRLSIKQILRDPLVKFITANYQVSYMEKASLVLDPLLRKKLCAENNLEKILQITRETRDDQHILKIEFKSSDLLEAKHFARELGPLYGKKGISISFSGNIIEIIDVTNQQFDQFIILIESLFKSALFSVPTDSHSKLDSKRQTVDEDDLQLGRQGVLIEACEGGDIKNVKNAIEELRAFPGLMDTTRQNPIICCYMEYECSRCKIYFIIATTEKRKTAYLERN